MATQTKKPAAKPAATAAKNLPAKTTAKAGALALADRMRSEGESGFENTDRSDYSVPFLVILQKLSPQVNKHDAKFIKGAEVGDLYNSATQKIVKSMRFIPVYYQRKIVEWIKRDDGGGFVGQHEPDSEIVKNATVDGPRMETNGHDLIDTRYWYGICLYDDNTMDRAIIAMSKTQLKKSRNWLTQARGMKLTDSSGREFPAPLWSYSYSIESVHESNDQGDWEGFAIGDPKAIEDETIYNAAKEFRELAAAGSVKMAVPDEDAPVGDEPSSM